MAKKVKTVIKKMQKNKSYDGGAKTIATLDLQIAGVNATITDTKLTVNKITNNVKNYNIINAAKGNVTINASGMKKEVTITTGTGHDKVTVGSGKTTVTTGKGNDTVTVNSLAKNSSIDGGAGKNTFVFAAKNVNAIIANNNVTLSKKTSTVKNFSTYEAKNGNVTLDVSKNTNTLALTTGSGKDTVIFDDKFGKNSSFNGGGGTDTLKYSAKADLILTNKKITSGSKSLTFTNFEKFVATNAVDLTLNNTDLEVTTSNKNDQFAIIGDATIIDQGGANDFTINVDDDEQEVSITLQVQDDSALNPCNTFTIKNISFEDYFDSDTGSVDVVGWVNNSLDVEYEEDLDKFTFTYDGDKILTLESTNDDLEDLCDTVYIEGTFLDTDIDTERNVTLSADFSAVLEKFKADPEDRNFNDLQFTVGIEGYELDGKKVDLYKVNLPDGCKQAKVQLSGENTDIVSLFGLEYMGDDSDEIAESLGKLYFSRDDEDTLTITNINTYSDEYEDEDGNVSGNTVKITFDDTDTKDSLHFNEGTWGNEELMAAIDLSQIRAKLTVGASQQQFAFSTSDGVNFSVAS